jgi:aspartate/methionine/tyrosine aminotransferase
MSLAPFKLERYFAQYEFNVEYTLCSSDCESVSIQDLLALEPASQEQFEKHWLGYTESAGAPSLRRAIAQIYETIDADQILVHTGAEEAIFLFMHAALEPGDHVIVHAPFYQSLAEVPSSLRCQVTRWRARSENGWAPDVDELAQLVRPTTRVLVANTPHNPTGFLMPRAEFERLAEFARAHKLILFSDEVYRESEYDAGARLPAACDLDPEAVSLGVMSKTFGLPGLRIGWIATHNRALYDRMAALIDYTTICNSAPSEFLAEIGLRHRHALAARNLELIKRNLGLLDAFFARQGEWFEWVRPQAGPIAFPRLKRGAVETFCHDLVMRHGVLLLPGSVFDDTENHFRIGFGRENMPAALARLEGYIAT